MSGSMHLDSRLRGNDEWEGGGSLSIAVIRGARVGSSRAHSVHKRVTPPNSFRG